LTKTRTRFFSGIHPAPETLGLIRGLLNDILAMGGNSATLANKARLM